MKFEIVVTSGFKRRVKQLLNKHHSLKTDISELVSSLEINPRQGESLVKDCFKIRMAISSKGKGKSSGSRVISCVKIEDNRVYLLSIFDKTEKTSISEKELDQLLQMAGI